MISCTKLHSRAGRTPLSSTACACAVQWKMWLITVFSVIYLTNVCAAQDLQDVNTVSTIIHTTRPPTPATTFKANVPTLQLQSSWLDVYPSETVEFKCSITGSPDYTLKWFKNGQEVPGSDRGMSLSSDRSVLTISESRKTDAGSYTCKGHHTEKGVTSEASNALTLTVHENKPRTTVSQSLNSDKVYRGESVTFTCTVDASSEWEYQWKHNKTPIPGASSKTYTINSLDYSNSGQYLCKAKRSKSQFNTEESEAKTLQVSDPPKPSLKLLSDWKDVFENETVEFSCEVDSPDWTFTWYRNQEEIDYDSVPSPDQKKSFLNVTLINKYEEGGYVCKVHLKSRTVSSEFSNPVDITVYDDLPRPTLSKDPGFNPMYVGETVSFACSVSVALGWEYKWYKDGLDLPETSKIITIKLGPTSGGKYSCRATRSETTLTDFSEEKPLEVLEIPVPSLNQTTPWSDFFPGERVSLICVMSSSPDWIYTWYKDGTEVKAVENVSFDSNRATLSISSASASHKGQYTCSGKLKDRSVISKPSPKIHLTVYDEIPEVTLTQDPDYTVMFPKESISFSCHISVSYGWKYKWYKNGNPLDRSGNSYSISLVRATDSGSYECRAERGTDKIFKSPSTQLEVKEEKPKPLMTQKPDVEKVYTGEPVSLECEVKLSSGWEYVWYKDGKEIKVNSHVNIPSATSFDSGTYSCMARRTKTKYETKVSDERVLRIFEIPVPSLNQVTSWLDVFPSEFVSFKCSMDGSSDWTYTWYKDGTEVQAGNGISFKPDQNIFNISSASASHRGRHSCSAKLKDPKNLKRSVSSNISNELQLIVYDTKPRPTLMQNPDHNLMHTGDPVSLSCHITVSSKWEYKWFKDNRPLSESENTYNITSVSTTNTGSYKCLTKRGEDRVFESEESQAVQLNIDERPGAHLDLLTGWSEVFSTDSLLLKCSVPGGLDWNYTWYKGGHPIEESYSEEHRVTPQNDPEQSQYTCKGIRMGRPSYSKHSDPYATKNLLLKRRVLLSISGFIVFGIAAVFIGCIVLRVCRKPAKEEYKPEEAELFVTMSQLKDRDDVPPPLVEYITDAALNSPSKEGDENGTICSEATPLPITPQEEQAGTTESTDATENNGGLVSFKQ